nr:plant virulence effector HPE1-like domain-containing protein [uncultured Gellertiella sp.]
MRILMTLAALLAAAPAFAGSIDRLKSLPPGTDVEGITRIGCTDCPAPVAKKNPYDVPRLTQGQQRLELRTISGKQKLYRTEAWLGGSPVVFVSTPTAEEIAALTPAPGKTQVPGADGIDRIAKTAAVPPSPAPLAARAPVTAAPAAPASLDASGFTLRP